MMKKIQYEVLIMTMKGHQITTADPSVMAQVLAHHDIETIGTTDVGETAQHIFIPYESIMSVTVHKISVDVDNSDDAFCTEE